MIFEYEVQKTFNQCIDIVDTGNTCLHCVSKDGSEYFMIIKTIMGKTSVLKFGPVIPDIPLLPIGFTVCYNKFDYKDKLISKEINLFINDFKKEINQVEELTESEVWELFPNIHELFNNA